VAEIAAALPGARWEGERRAAEPAAGRDSKRWPGAGQPHRPELGVSTGSEGSVGLCSPAQLLGTSEVWAGISQFGSEMALLSVCKKPACSTLARRF